MSPTDTLANTSIVQEERAWAARAIACSVLGHPDYGRECDDVPPSVARRLVVAALCELGVDWEVAWAAVIYELGGGRIEAPLIGSEAERGEVAA